MKLTAATLDGLKPASPPAGKRLSTDPDDPGFALFAAVKSAGQGVTVTIDGAVAKNVVTADEGEGFILSKIVAMDGAVLKNPRTGEPKLVRRNGVVRISVR